MKSLRWKMIFMIGLPTLVIYTLIVGYIWIYLNRQKNLEIETEMKYLAGIYADKFDVILQKGVNVADMTSKTAGIIDDLSEKNIYLLLRSNLEQLPYIYGSCMAFEPGTIKQDDSLYAPYVYKRGSEIKQMNITRDVYDWYNDPQWEWFRVPKRLNQGYWSPPYFDEGAGNVCMITCSKPFYRNGKFCGVTTVDLHLRRLKETAQDDILSNLKFEVLAQNGEYIYSDRTERIMHKTIFQLAAEHDRPDWAELGQAMASGQQGMIRIRGMLDSARYLVFYAPIPSTGWSFSCRIPEAEAMAGLNKRRAIAALGLGLTLVLIVSCIVFISGRITRPITHLNQKVLDVAQGNLDVQIEDIASHDEIGTLSRSFNKMTADLREYVKKSEALAKLERDLQIAKQIQKNTLPTQMPKLSTFEIDAWNEPAEETGGDIYDVIGYQVASDDKSILISAENSDRAILLLADATGHGIGPALSVTQLRSMLRMAVHISQDISVIARHVNEQLCADLPSGRFITAWLGEIDSNQNTLKYFSAGQGPLLRYNAESNEVDFFDTQSCPFGITNCIDTTISEPIPMNQGDIFAVISDGIFEATNEENEQFGSDRTIEVIKKQRDQSVQEILSAIRKAVDEFTGNAPADDDRTIILIKRN